MKATVIVDNIENKGLPGEWGLCIYIAYEDKKILLDTGASALFAANAKKLQIPLPDVDFAVLSHAHYDHANGMGEFFEINQRAKFYLQQGCAENCYKKKWFLPIYIGISRGFLTKYQDRIIYTSGNTDICAGVRLLSHTTPNLQKIGKQEHMYQKRQGKWYPDDFSHEQSLIFETAKGLVVFNSCSHGGAANIIQEVEAACPGQRVYALIGGFHLYRKSEAEVRELAKKLQDTGVSHICTGHCTGERAYGILKEELGERLSQLHVGFEMEF